MKELYKVEGILNRGFVGQITYTVCLEETYSKLDIRFSFDADKRTYRPDEVTPALIRDTIDSARRNNGLDIDEARARQVILGDMKTEIHTLATLNDAFIGCIHRQLTDRHMRYDGEYASEGCVPCPQFDGVLKVTVLVFNVIKDETRYQLSVSAE
ncbi:MAG: hypothetical protein J6Q17_02945 [Clostridia bacterium]|nr:hypothetical protein [Clostridia bacterium]